MYFQTGTNYSFFFFFYRFIIIIIIITLLHGIDEK